MGVDHQPHRCVSLGDMPVRARGVDGLEYNLMIKNVRYAPTFKDSLISINQLWLESKVDVSFKDVCCLITPCGKRLPFDKPKGTGLYMWKVLSNAAKHDTHNNLAKPVRATKSVTFSQDLAAVKPAAHKPPALKQTGSALSFQPTHSSKSISHISALAPDVAAKFMHSRLHVASGTSIPIFSSHGTCRSLLGR